MPSRYKNLHNNIKEISDNCNWGNYEVLLGKDGLCFGLVFMWGQALLCNDLETYYKRMNILIRNYEFRDKKLSQLINESVENVPQKKSSSHRFDQCIHYNDNKLLFSLRPFLGSLLLYHNPSRTSLFLIDKCLYTQNSILSSRYAIPDMLHLRENMTGDNAIGLPFLKIHHKPYVGTTVEYADILQSLVNAYSEFDTNFFIVLTSHNHAVAIGRLGSNVIFYDANLMSGFCALHAKYGISETKTLTRKHLTRAFGLYCVEEPTALNISVYMRPEFHRLNKREKETENRLRDSYILNSLKDKIIKDLKSHSSFLAFGRKNKSRAEFSAKTITLINTLSDFHTYLTEELLLISGKKASIFIMPHYKHNHSIDVGKEKSPYYRIINNTLKNISYFLVKSTEIYYDIVLPKMIKKNYQTKYSFLYIACEGGHKRVVGILLKNKADVNKGTAKASPLFIACQHGHTDVVNLLLKNKADANKFTKDCNSSPLIVACGGGYLDIVNLLIKYKTDATRCNKDGVSPLISACEKGNIDIIKILINNMANINGCTKEGISPLITACKYGHLNIVELLVSKKVDVNRPTKDGKSPLMIACGNGYLDIAKVLIKNNANVNFASSSQHTSLMLACQNKHIKTVSFFLTSLGTLDKTTNDIAKYLISACGKENSNIKILNLLKSKFPNHDINEAWNMPREEKKPELLTPLLQACYFNYKVCICWLLDNYAGIIKDNVKFENHNALEWYKTHNKKLDYDPQIELRLKKLN
ncbi:MAG: ankyrin repeat domain-containing protein [Lentisphaerae bacterium]|nr:ankyrin repeat domain-containing protein [Lentisphaerota bacterium]MCP4100659.1 ankyrin repeat domain-containing protein [Lentisphaerota bacterium]